MERDTANLADTNKKEPTDDTHYSLYETLTMSPSVFSYNGELGYIFYPDRGEVHFPDGKIVDLIRYHGE